MKLKQVPADFRVEEVSNVEISKEKSPHRLFRVTKQGIETLALMQYLSKKFSVPPREIGIAGLKDKHALTTQFLSVPAQYAFSDLKEPNLEVTFVGYTGKKLKVGDLEGNRFEITVRDVKKGEIEGLKSKAKTVPVIGVPNYFDSQRFGSVINGEFIAKAVLQKNYEQAVKLFLTGYSKSEPKQLKDQKRQIAANWGDLSKVTLVGGVLAGVAGEYLKTGDWLAAYKRIPASLRELYVSAYQGYLWNECVKELLKEVVDKKALYNIPYTLGSLVFYKRLDEQERAKLPTTLSLIGEGMNLHQVEEPIIRKVLEREKITLEDFRVFRKSGNFFKPRQRSILLSPSKFGLSEPELDELNDRGKKNRFKVVARFFLPKGSYATVVLKRLCNQ